ncbi:hypothetical protein Leryth_013530 [Lithospermum erythrorhizon]|nr:hypothetical protein Leryth_013530 [Lithospermum erythrorhizon]
MTSVPKPLKFWRPHYGTLKTYYEKMTDADLKRLLADILSVLALTMSAEGERGEAKSAQLIGQAISSNPAFITLRKIEAAREIAQTISRSANKVYLSSEDLLLNLQEMKLDVPGRN